MDIENKKFIKIRAGLYSDALSIAKTHVLCWTESYQELLSQNILNKMTLKRRQQMWKKILSKKNNKEVCLIAIDKNNRIIGFIHGGKAKKPLSSKDIEIYALYLLKSFQKKGIGTALFKKFKAQFPQKKIYLWVLKKNPTRSFYEKMGGITKSTKKSILFGDPIEEISYLFR